MDSFSYLCSVIINKCDGLWETGEDSEPTL
jgi:hypothetical protein